MAIDRMASSQNTMWLPPVTMNSRIRKPIAPPMPALMRCWLAKVIGAPLISACSLANAITEPEKVTAPMASPSDISTRLWAWILPGVPMPNASGAFSAAAATNTAARPTSEWNAATSCGSAVIWMREAMK